MKRIKNAFGRLWLKHQKMVIWFVWISFVLSMLFFSIWFLSLIPVVSDNKFIIGNFSEILYKILTFGGFLFFGVLYLLFAYSKIWVKELPEYAIKEAEKILENPSIRFNLKNLKELIQEAKRTKKTEKLEEWMKDFKEFESINTFEQEFDSLKRQIEEWNEKRVMKADRKFELKLKLFC